MGRRRRGAGRAARTGARRPRHRRPRAARELRGRMRIAPAALRSRSPSATEPGGSRSTAGHTVDFTPFAGTIEEDLATRDFTINAIAVPLAGGEAVDPFAGRADLDARLIRVVSPSVFTDDPLRLMRAVRLEDELGFRLEPETERLVREHAALVTEPARERTLAELVRLSVDGYRRADELGLLAPLEGSSAGLDRPALVDRPAFRLVAVFGDALRRLSGLERDEALRAEASPRAGARGRLAPVDPPLPPGDRAVGARTRSSSSVRRSSRARFSPRGSASPAEPLLRGDELGVPPGPEIGRLLELIAEERAAGTISTPRGGARARQARAGAVEVALSARSRDRHVRPIRIRSQRGGGGLCLRRSAVATASA